MEHKKLVLDVVGGIRNYVGDRRISPNIKMLGMVDELRPYYESADLVILPVVSGGGAAMKTIEAMLHERPIVGTRHAFRGLPPEIVSTIGSFNTPAELARAIISSIASEENYAEAARKTRLGAQILRDQNYFERLAAALDAVRLPERYSGI